VHNASKALLGTSLSSAKEISIHGSDPATYKAGLAVRLKSDSSLSLLKADGRHLGISLGRSLSDIKKTAVVRTGESVPVLAHLKRATATITITNHANLVSGTDDALAIAGVSFVFQAGAVTPGDATARAHTSNEATATSLSAQINANATASAKVYAAVAGAVVTLYSVADGVGSTGTGNDIAVAYTDNDSNVGLTLAGLSGGKMSGGSNTISDIAYIAKGAKMYVNDATGKADIAISGFCTITDATYISEELTGIDEDAAEVPVALVDMPGGL
jgi:hypothetical protein